MKADGRDERVFLGCLSGLEIYRMFWGCSVVFESRVRVGVMICP
jgi:hypothetical protein